MTTDKLTKCKRSTSTYIRVSATLYIFCLLTLNVYQLLQSYNKYLLRSGHYKHERFLTRLVQTLAIDYAATLFLLFVVSSLTCSPLFKIILGTLKKLFLLSLLVLFLQPNTAQTYGIWHIKLQSFNRRLALRNHMTSRC